MFVAADRGRPTSTIHMLQSPDILRHPPSGMVCSTDSDIDSHFPSNISIASNAS